MKHFMYRHLTLGLGIISIGDNNIVRDKFFEVHTLEIIRQIGMRCGAENQFRVSIVLERCKPLELHEFI